MKAILHGGDECDAFSKKSRRLLRWKSGTIRWIKRKFWKRQRRAIRVELKKEIELN